MSPVNFPLRGEKPDSNPSRRQTPGKAVGKAAQGWERAKFVSSFCRALSQADYGRTVFLLIRYGITCSLTWKPISGRGGSGGGGDGSRIFMMRWSTSTMA